MGLPAGFAIRSQGTAQVKAVMRLLFSTETSSSTCLNGCLSQILPFLIFPCWYNPDDFMSTLKHRFYLNFLFEEYSMKICKVRQKAAVS